MPVHLISGQPSHAPGPRRPPEYTFKIIRDYPHDPAAFTQGLVYHDGFFYEGTGLNGRSQLRKVRVETGEVVQHVDLPGEYFGEGIAIFRNKVIQLTWQSHIGFVYNLSDFKLLRQFSIQDHETAAESDRATRPCAHFGINQDWEPFRLGAYREPRAQKLFQSGAQAE